MSFIEYEDETPPPSRSNFNQNLSASTSNNNTRNNTGNLLDPSRRSQISQRTGGTGASPRESRVDSNNLVDNVNAMRHRQSLLDGLRNSGFASADACPPPAMMYKPGSADENASGFTKVFKRLASSWKKRKVSIVNNTNFQYEDPETKKLSGTLKLDDISQVKMINRAVMKDRGSPENLRDFGWYLIAGGREYIFACETSQTRDVWVGYLSALLKQRQNDEQYLGDEGDSRSYQNTARNSKARGASNLEAQYSGGPNNNNNNNADYQQDLAPEALKANQDVFDAVAQYKSQQYMARRGGGSEDGGSGGDDNERNRLLDDDDEDDDDEEESSAPSGDSDIVVERGEEVVAATIDKSKVKKTAIIHVPAPNAAYRRENVVIEALFEDLRTQEPDHVRLAGLETPDCAVSYFQPQLLRLAQDGDLPGDLPPKPLLVSAFLANANQPKAPLRNDSLLPSSRIKAVAKELERMELVQRTPSYKGLHIVVVDADGLVVGGSKTICDSSTKGVTSLYDFANYICCRHSAAKAFSLITYSKSIASTRHGSVIGQQQQQPRPSGIAAAAAYQNINNNSIAFNIASARQNSVTLTGSPTNKTKTVAFPDHPEPAAASSKNQQQQKSPNKDDRSEFPRINNNNNNNHQQTGSPTSLHNNENVNFENRSFSALNGAGHNSNDDTSSVTGGGAAGANGGSSPKGIGRLFSQSIAALRSRSVGGAGVGGGVGSASIAAMQHHHPSLLSESAIAHLTNIGGTANLFGKDGNAAGPSAHGPVIVIETTKRKVTITDAAYRSDILGNDTLVKKRPPLYLITTEEIIQK